METCLGPFFDFLQVNHFAPPIPSLSNLFSLSLSLSLLLFLLLSCLNLSPADQNQCIESKKHQSVVFKFSEFLVLYAQHNKTRAAPIIYRHLNLLQSVLAKTVNLLLLLSSLKDTS